MSFTIGFKFWRQKKLDDGGDALLAYMDETRQYILQALSLFIVYGEVATW